MPKKKFENDAVFLNQIPEFENVKTIKLEKDYLKVITQTYSLLLL